MRTARVDGETLELLRQVFGTVPNAHRQLRLAGLVDVSVFRRAFLGGTVRPVIVEAIQLGWDRFAERLLETQRRRGAA